MYRFQSIILVTVLFALLSSCANQIAPEGGPKDETPPTLVSSTPKQGEVNFDGQEIQLTFDEYVNTNQPKQEIIITPTILQEYDIKVRKKVVTLTFEEPLDDSTTYTINFREAIQDITEKNTPTDLKLAFSTGSFLDSMSVEGTVLNLLTQKPLANTTVGIYKVSDTLDIIEHKPTYFTKTSDDGKYKIENVKAGEYEILAFNDANKNLTLQTSSEAYAFLTNSITLDTALSQIDFVANILDLDTIQITRSRQIATTYHVKYNKYVNQYNVVSFDSSDYIYSNFIDNSHETIQLYNTFDIQDSIPIFITVWDSLNTQQTDTLFLQFKENKRKPAEFQSSLNLKKIATNVKQLSASLTFTKTNPTI